MKKPLQMLALVLGVLLLAATPAFAEGNFGIGLGAGLGAGFVLIGAGFGFGKIGAAALESMARQPDKAVIGSISTNMLIIAALLEGATFFALIICIILAVNAK